MLASMREPQLLLSWLRVTLALLRLGVGLQPVQDQGKYGLVGDRKLNGSFRLELLENKGGTRYGVLLAGGLIGQFPRPTGRYGVINSASTRPRALGSMMTSQSQVGPSVTDPA